MLYGVNINGDKISATKDREAYCPCCQEELISKCGEIKIWHWAHKHSTECFTKPETAWHLEWKSYYPKELCEIVLFQKGKKKIADVITTDGTVIEFQNSSISPYEIRIREYFYGNMVWVFNVIDIFKNDTLQLRRNDKGYFTFRWKWPRKTIGECKKPVYLHYQDSYLFQLKKYYHKKTPCGGWGYIISREKFINEFS